MAHIHDVDRPAPIKSKGWDGTYTLRTISGVAVVAGHRIGDTIIDGGRAPHKPGSTGKVWPKSGGEYFAHVFDLVWTRDAPTTLALETDEQADARIRSQRTAADMAAML